MFRLVPGTALLAAVAIVCGCKSGESSSRLTPAAQSGGVAAVGAPPPAPAPPPTKSQPVTFSSSDGATLAGDLFVAEDQSAPAVVLVHRPYRDRAEWKPLVERLTTASKRYTIIAFDLRGAGASSRPPKERIEDAPAHLDRDVHAAIGQVMQATHHAARGVVLVGSSLGATTSAKAALDEPQVVALALISPGAALDGQDLYHPYADVRDLPTFAAASGNDNVAREPLEALEKMSKTGTIKRYPGTVHGADEIGRTNPELWSDIEAWLMGVFDEQPRPRQPIYGKAPTGGK